MASISAKALTCITVSFGLAMSVLFDELDTPGSAHSVGIEARAWLLSILLAAGICAWIAKKSKVEWGWWKFILVFILVENVMLFLATYRHSMKDPSSADQVVSASTLFKATWPDGWAHSSKLIKSDTANHDEVIGTTDSLTKLDGPGVLLMTVSCTKWDNAERQNIDAVTEQSSASGAIAYKEDGFIATPSPPKPTHVGPYEGREYELIGTKGSSTRKGITAIAYTPTCAMTLSFISEDDDYERYLPEFVRLKSSIH
jgi:hypothetical protein